MARYLGRTKEINKSSNELFSGGLLHASSPRRLRDAGAERERESTALLHDEGLDTDEELEEEFGRRETRSSAKGKGAVRRGGDSHESKAAPFSSEEEGSEEEEADNEFEAPVIKESSKPESCSCTYAVKKLLATNKKMKYLAP